VGWPPLVRVLPSLPKAAALLAVRRTRCGFCRQRQRALIWRPVHGRYSSWSPLTSWRTIRRTFAKMLRNAVLVVVVLSLTACSRLFPDTPSPPDPYRGRPVANLTPIFGPPTLQVDVGNNQRAFHWIHYDRAGWAGSLQPAGGAPPTEPVPQRECHLWVIADTLVPPESGLSNWIVDRWGYRAVPGC
jgi:hypothetical protein